MEKKEQLVRCGSCKYWKRRAAGWGSCHRNAPNPYILGPSSGQYFADWEKARLEGQKDKGKYDWSPPANWRVIWPETKVTDICGEWVDLEGEVFFPPLK